MIGGKIKMAKMPIRNKSKDNPYNLGFDENKNIYKVEFVDNKKVMHNVEISVEVYEVFDKFELEDIYRYINIEVILNIQKFMKNL